MSTDRQEQGYLASHVGGFLAGLLMGGLIGSGAALLLAPQSGKRTRAQIRQESVELHGQVVDTVGNAVAQARDQAHQISANARKEAEKLQRRGQEMLDGQKDVVSDVVEAEKQALQDISSG